MAISTASPAIGWPQKPDDYVFRCPAAYLGIREDLLPTHWSVVRGRRKVRLKASLVQRQSLLCTYQNKTGMSVGTVQRLVPAGYKCISDGQGVFRCSRTH